MCGFISPPQYFPYKCSFSFFFFFWGGGRSPYLNRTTLALSCLYLRGRSPCLLFFSGEKGFIPHYMAVTVERV